MGTKVVSIMRNTLWKALLLQEIENIFAPHLRHGSCPNSQQRLNLF